MREEMERDANVILIGEDVGTFGGVWGVSGDLMKIFGEDRVRGYPDQRGRDRRGGPGRGDDGAAADRRDHVRRFSPRRRGPTRQSAREGPLHERWQGETCPSPFASQRAHPDHPRSALAVAGRLVHETCPGLKIATPATPADAKGCSRRRFGRGSVLSSSTRCCTRRRARSRMIRTSWFPFGQAHISRPGRM